MDILPSLLSDDLCHSLHLIVNMSINGLLCLFCMLLTNTISNFLVLLYQHLTLIPLFDVLHTVSIHLLPQVIDHNHQFFIVCACINGIVEFFIPLCDFQQIIC